MYAHMRMHTKITKEDEENELKQQKSYHCEDNNIDNDDKILFELSKKVKDSEDQ